MRDAHSWLFRAEAERIGLERGAEIPGGQWFPKLQGGGGLTEPRQAVPFECGADNAGVVDGVGRQLGVWHYGSPESARTLKMWETGFRWRRACVGSSECARLQHRGTARGSGTVLPEGPVLPSTEAQSVGGSPRVALA